MKRIIFTSVTFFTCLLPILYASNSNAQSANTALSNLATTAVNKNLIPGTNNSIDLGSNSKRWKNIYLGNSLYLKGSLALHSPGTGNFFIGNDAGNNSLTGSYNTGVGNGTLLSVTTGSYNTASGNGALLNNATGSYNTATGQYALVVNIDGYSNTANGFQSLYSNTNGGDNTAVGVNAMYYNTTGSRNTAIGRFSMFSNTTGFSNTATGEDALYSNTTGYYNTANGSNALHSDTSGYYNTAMGAYSLFSNTNGSFNTATGDNSLFYNLSGRANTAIGNHSMEANTTGQENTAIGNFSLGSNTTGSYNTALGSSAGVTTGNLTNATAIGYNAIVNASNKIRFGNSSVMIIEGAVAYTISDGRFKKDITEEVKGLSFINKLRPVIYNLEARKLDEFMMKNISAQKRDSILKRIDYREAEKMRRSGFVAQEVEKAAKESGYTFDGVYKPVDENGNYSLAYGEFVVPLVKAVQELSKMNDEKDAKIIAQDKKIDAQQKQIDELKTMMQSLQQNFEKCNPCSQSATNNQQSTSNIQARTSNISAASLEQNVPNPFTSATTINYTLPVTYTAAKIIVSNEAGKVLKEINVSGSGKGSMQLNVSMFASGVYSYSLYAEGKLIATKKMVK